MSPAGISSVQWDLRLAKGGIDIWQFALWQRDGLTPYSTSGHIYEYVVRSAPQDSGTPLIRLQTDNPGNPLPVGGGTLSLPAPTSLLSVVQLQLNPAATAQSGIVAPGTYFHALWQDYNLASAKCIFWGQFMVDQAAAP